MEATLRITFKTIQIKSALMMTAMNKPELWLVLPRLGLGRIHTAFIIAIKFFEIFFFFGFLSHSLKNAQFFFAYGLDSGVFGSPKLALAGTLISDDVTGKVIFANHKSFYFCDISIKYIFFYCKTSDLCQ